MCLALPPISEVLSAGLFLLFPVSAKIKRSIATPESGRSVEYKIVDASIAPSRTDEKNAITSSGAYGVSSRFNLISIELSLHLLHQLLGLVALDFTFPGRLLKGAEL